MELSGSQNQLNESKALAEFYSNKVLNESEIRGAEANLFGFLSLLIEIDKGQKNK
jgi:hypothetical protein